MVTNTENVRLGFRLVDLVEVASFLLEVSDLLLVRYDLVGLGVDLLNAFDFKFRLQQS